MGGLGGAGLVLAGSGSSSSHPALPLPLPARLLVQLLLARIGDTLMLYLLLHVSLFAALPNSCCLQLRWVRSSDPHRHP